MNKEKLQLILKQVFHSFYWLLVLLIIVDQISKVIVLSNMTLGQQVTIIPNFFHFTYVRNTGAAWSMFDNQMFLLSIVSLVAGVLMLTYRIIKRNKLTFIYKLLWAVIIAGTFGNFIDRAFYKLLTGTDGVVDMFHFQFGNSHFPVFNIADMLLVVGLLSLIVITFINDSKESKIKKEEERKRYLELEKQSLEKQAENKSEENPNE